jgi:hypothetical protein
MSANNQIIQAIAVNITDELLDASTSTNILKVLGNSGDKVYAAGFGDSTIDKTVDGITYDVYTHDDANTNVKIIL